MSNATAGVVPAADAAPAQDDRFAEFMKEFGGPAPATDADGDPAASDGTDAAPDADADDAAEQTDTAAAFDPAALVQLINADPAKGAETLGTLMTKFRESVLAEAQQLADGHATHKAEVDKYFKDNADMEPHRDLFAILAKDAAKTGEHKDVKSLVTAVGASARKMLGKKAVQAPVLPGAGPTGSTGAKPASSQDDLAADFEKRMGRR